MDAVVVVVGCLVSLSAVTMTTEYLSMKCTLW